MTQPTWKFIANLGDVNPIDYGGLFVFEDTTGVYPPEAEYLECPESDDRNEVYYVYRFSLDKCSYVNGVLSDNKYHPELSAWWAKPESEKLTRPQDTTYLSLMSETMGIDEDEYIRLFTSGYPLERAQAYRDIGVYHGFDNLDSYPLILSRNEVCKRYVWYQAYRRIHNA